MRLTEEKVVKLIQEAYDKRLNYYLNEKMDVKNIGSLDNADMLKVRRVDTGAEYTFGGVVDGGLIKLFLPDEPRMNPAEMSQKRLLKDELPADTGADQNKPVSTSPEDDRDYILVDEKTFEEKFELAWLIKVILKNY